MNISKKTLDFLLNEVNQGNYQSWAEDWVKDAYQIKEDEAVAVKADEAISAVIDFLESRIIEIENP